MPYKQQHTLRVEFWLKIIWLHLLSVLGDPVFGAFAQVAACTVVYSNSTYSRSGHSSRRTTDFLEVQPAWFTQLSALKSRGGGRGGRKGDELGI